MEHSVVKNQSGRILSCKVPIGLGIIKSLSPKGFCHWRIQVEFRTRSATINDREIANMTWFSVVRFVVFAGRFRCTGNLVGISLPALNVMPNLEGCRMVWSQWYWSCMQWYLQCNLISSAIIYYHHSDVAVGEEEKRSIFVRVSRSVKSYRSLLAHFHLSNSKGSVCIVRTKQILN